MRPPNRGPRQAGRLPPVGLFRGRPERRQRRGLQLARDVRPLQHRYHRYRPGQPQPSQKAYWTLETSSLLDRRSWVSRRPFGKNETVFARVVRLVYVLLRTRSRFVALERADETTVHAKHHVGIQMLGVIGEHLRD